MEMSHNIDQAGHGIDASEFTTRIPLWPDLADYADHAWQSRGEDGTVKAENRYLRTFVETDLKDEAAKILLAVR
jgi:hypothetical protein